MHDFCVRKSIISQQIRSKIQESGAQGVLFDEKTEGRISRDTVLLKDKSKIQMDDTGDQNFMSAARISW
jgi:hypothetical protein